MDTIDRMRTADVLFETTRTNRTPPDQEAPKPDPAPVERLPSKRVFYPTEGMLPSVAANMQRIADLEGLSVDEQAKARTAYAAMVDDHQLPFDTATLIHDAMTAEILAGRGEPETDAATLVTLNEAVRRDLRERYGDEAPALLERTIAYVKNDPRLAEVLSVGRVGSAPAVVRAIVEHVRRVR